MTLARALVPLFERMDDSEEALTSLQGIVQDYYPQVLTSHMGEMRRSKLGLLNWSAELEEGLWTPLFALMQKSELDYTIFWRQLSHVTAAEAAGVVEAQASAAAAGGKLDGPEVLNATEAMLKHLLPAFFEEPRANREGWQLWLALYAKRLASDGRADSERQAEMRLASPKYIPREWMLAEAYTKAEAGDFSAVHQLAEVFSRPYDEHKGEVEAK